MEVRSPRDWMARWGCDQWQLGVTGQKWKTPLVGLDPDMAPAETPWEASLGASSPTGSPGGSLVPTHWLNNAGKLSLLTGLFHNLRKRRKRREGSWGRDIPHSLPLGLLLTLTFRYLSPAGS